MPQPRNVVSKKQKEGIVGDVIGNFGQTQFRVSRQREQEELNGGKPICNY